MRYIGLDYGERRIGVAISDEKGGFAFPKETIPNDASVIGRLAKMAVHDGVATFVIGDTRSMNGGENVITKASDAFAEKLQQFTGLSVVRSREAWSSHEAARFAPKGKEHDDAAAAAIILQRYLDAQAKSE